MSVPSGFPPLSFGKLSLDVLRRAESFGGMSERRKLDDATAPTVRENPTKRRRRKRRKRDSRCQGRAHGSVWALPS